MLCMYVCIPNQMVNIRRQRFRDSCLSLALVHWISLLVLFITPIPLFTMSYGPRDPEQMGQVSFYPSPLYLSDHCSFV